MYDTVLIAENVLLSLHMQKYRIVASQEVIYHDGTFQKALFHHINIS